MTAATAAAFFVAGAVAAILLTVIYAVTKRVCGVAWSRWRFRRAIEYRSVVAYLDQFAPGHPHCICFPGRRHKHGPLTSCSARKHRP